MFDACAVCWSADDDDHNHNSAHSDGARIVVAVCVENLFARYTKSGKSWIK